MANKNENRLHIKEVAIVKTKSEKVKARADVRFDDFELKGFKILHNEERGTDYVTPPSDQAGVYWRPLFRTEKESDWKRICQRILKEYDESLIREAVEEIEN